MKIEYFEVFSLKYTKMIFKLNDSIQLIYLSIVRTSLTLLHHTKLFSILIHCKFQNYLNLNFWNSWKVKITVWNNFAESNLETVLKHYNCKSANLYIFNSWVFFYKFNDKKILTQILHVASFCHFQLKTWIKNFLLNFEP